MFGLKWYCIGLIVIAVFAAVCAGMAWLLYITNPKRRGK